MSLYKRKKKGKDGELYELGPWQYLFYIDGKRFKGSTSTEDKKQAVKIEARKRVAAEHGQSIAKAKVVTVRDLITGFDGWVKTINKAPKTIADYRNGCRLILASELAGMRADRVTDDDVSATRFHKSPYSTNCALRTLRRAFHRALKKKELREIPKIKLVEAPRRERMVSDLDEKRLLKAIEFAAANRRYKKRPASPLGDVFTTMQDSGMRDGEVVRMEIENINWTAARYFVSKGKTKRARRHVPLSERVLGLLRARCGDRKSGWVFPSVRKGKHITGGLVNKQFVKARKAAGLPSNLVLYTGRHDCGTYLMEETGNLKAVMLVLGHADVKSALRYQKPRLDPVREALNSRNRKSKKKAAVLKFRAQSMAQR